MSNLLCSLLYASGHWLERSFILHIPLLIFSVVVRYPVFDYYAPRQRNIKKCVSVRDCELLLAINYQIKSYAVEGIPGSETDVGIAGVTGAWVSPAIASEGVEVSSSSSAGLLGTIMWLTEEETDISLNSGGRKQGTEVH